MSTATGTPTTATGGTATIFGGTKAWSNPTNIEGNTANATASITTTLVTTDDLIGEGFGFSVPATATINGITFSDSDSDGAGTATLHGIKLLKAGTAVGTAKTIGTGNNWGVTLGTTTYGSGTDLWGTTWTPADINNSGFGVALAVDFNSTNDTLSTRNWVTTVTFTIPAPTVTSCSPNNGSAAGGTSVTITGTNFFAPTSSFPTAITATFGGTAATSVTFVSSTSITCVTPAHAAGVVNVVVTNPDGQTGTGTSAFTFNAATTNTANFFKMF